VEEAAAEQPLEFPSSSFRYTPLRHLRVVLVRFIQGLFSAAPSGSYRWDPDDALTEIFVQSDSRVDAETIGHRPAISVTRGPLQLYSLGMDDLSAYDLMTGRKEKVVLVPGTATFNCVSRVSLEAEDIAWVVAEHTWLLRGLLMQSGFFEIGRGIGVSAPSSAGSIVGDDQGDEFTVVSVSVPFQLSRKSSVTPLNKLIVNNIQQSLSTRRPRLAASYGVPAQYSMSLHDCAPPSFAPDASDAHGATPDPAGTNTNYLPKAPHPLNPMKEVFVRRVYPNRPGQQMPRPGGVPIPDPCVEQSP
jgi:hypothetical protein